jgi:hypothetical protein
MVSVLMVMVDSKTMHSKRKDLTVDHAEHTGALAGKLLRRIASF